MKYPTHIVIAIIVMIVAQCASADEWTRFRGPNGTGIAPAMKFPDTWTEEDYAWQVELAGSGESSPVVFNNQVFVTSANPETGDIHLEAISVVDGKPAWRKTMPGKTWNMNQLNSYASTTPAVDDKHVYISYYVPGNVSLVAFTHAGEEAWRVDLGDFTGEHGFSCSPVVVQDLVCIQGDNDEQGYLVALDSKTGVERWRATREAGRHAYSTPATMNMPDGTLAIIFTSEAAGITAVNAKTGSLLWQQKDALPDRTVNSPIVAGDLLIAGCGSGGNGKQLIAYRISESGQQELYKLSKNIPNVPTGIVVGNLLFLIHDRGTFTCLDAATGESRWTKRLGDKYYCSPILLGDRLLCVSMSGEAIMLAADGEFKVLGRTDLGEGTESTPAVADGRLFLRTTTKLRCLAE